MKRHEESASAVIEPLENRLLMSAAPAADVTGDISVDIGDFPAHYHSHKIKYQEPVVSTWDAGDFYWYEDEQIKLFRMLDAIVVGVEKGVDPEQLNLELTRPGG